MSQYYTNVYEEEGLRRYITGVFTTMGIGLLISAAMAYYCYIDIISGGVLYKLLFTGFVGPFSLLIMQIGIALFLSTRLRTMSVTTARLSFFVYCMVTGLTLGIIPLAYGFGTVFQAFIYAAVMFFSCAVIGHTTRFNISRLSSMFMGGLISLVICGFLEVIFHWGASLFIGTLGIAMFMGMTAWDMQRIKQSYYQLSSDGEMASKFAVINSLNLYLDFVNIFLYVLRFVGNVDND